MADAGIVKATFILSSKGMVKGIQDLIKQLGGLQNTGKGVGKTATVMNKNLSAGQKVVQDLERSTTMYTHQLRQQLNATKLSNKEREAFIDTHRRLKQGVNDGTVSVNKYHQAMGQLSKRYGLAYEKGRVFEEQTKRTSKLMANLQKQQIITPDKMLGSGAGMDEFARKIEKATAELREGIMTMKQYKAYARELGKSTGVKVLNNGFVATPEYMARANSAIKNYTSAYDAMLLQQKRGLTVTDAHRDAVSKAEKGIRNLDFWVKNNVVSQSAFNRVQERQSGNLAKSTQTVSQLTRSYGSLTNATNMVSRSQRMQNYAMQVAAMRYNAVGLAVGAFGGMILGTFVTDFMMARTQSIKLDQQMQQFFQTMKLGKGAFDNFNKALDDYVAKVPKVSKYTVGSTIAQVGKLNNLSLEQMKAMIPLTGDMVNMMQLNGRTAEDTMLAINDAFDGQFKRLQEIGVQGKEQLKTFGYDGSADSLIKALTAISNQKGWGDLSKNVTTTSDAFQILGNALDRIIVPAINLLTPAIVYVSVAIGNFLGYLNDAPGIIKALAATLLIAGGAFTVMKVQMAWANFTGSQFMATMTGLDEGMQRVTSTAYSATQVSAMAGHEFDQLGANLAELEHNASGANKSWMALNSIERNGLITRQKALLQYDGLSRVQKMQIQTRMRLTGVSKAEAMTQLFGAEAINARKVSQVTSLALDKTSIELSQMSTMARMKEAFMTGFQSNADKGRVISLSLSSIATKIQTFANYALATSANVAGMALSFMLSPLGLIAIGLAGVTVAIYALTASQRGAIDIMKRYNDFMENGEEKIQNLKDASVDYKQKAEELDKQRQKMVANGEDTTKIEADIAKALENSKTAAEDATKAQEALNYGRKRGKEIDAQNSVDRSKYLDRTNQKMKEAGLITEDEYQKQSQYTAMVQAGTDQQYKALQRTNRIRSIGKMQMDKIIDGEHQYSRAYQENAKKGGKAIQDRASAWDELAEAKMKAETSDDWMTSISAWGEQGIIRMKIGWIDTVMQFEQFKIELGGVYNDMEAWWNGAGAWWSGLATRIGEIWGETVSYLQGAWGNTVAFFTGIGQSIYSALKPIYCIIMGCSPGIVPAIMQLYATAQTYFNALLAFLWSIINPIVATLMNGWRAITYATRNTWNTVKTIIWGTLNTVWTKVTSVVGMVKNKFTSMKDSLVSSAKAIYDGVWTNHLKPLVDKIGEFWNKITNPGSWFSGGGKSGGKAGSPGMAGYYAGGAGTTRHAPGIRTSKNNNIFSGLGSAIKGMARNAVYSAGLPMDPRFQGYAGPLQTNKRIEDPRQCQEKYGKQCYAGGWDFGSNWVEKIKQLVSTWSANIFGSSIPILDLANGKGNLGIFEVLANRLISGTSYDFYYNGRYSDKEALSRKAFNCWDGAEILIHLANALGLSASMGRGTWNGYGHVWAVVNGKNFDTTAFQHGHGWTSPSVRGYAGPSTTTASSKLEVKIDMRNSSFKGIDDVEKQMENVATKVFGKFLGKNPAIGF